MKIAVPRLSAILNEGTDLAYQISAFRFEVEETIFKEELVIGEYKSNLIFSSCLFEKCNFTESKLPDGRYCDVVFRNCDFSAADLTNTSFSRVEFIDCKLAGTNLAACKFNQVLVRNSQCRYSIWSQSLFSGCLFEESDLKSVALDNCKLEKVGFSHSNLSESEFYQTYLKEIDLTTSIIDGIRINGPELRGAEVTSLQAIGLARILGVIIRG